VLDILKLLPDVTPLVCLFLAQKPPVDQGLLIHEVSISHTTMHHSRQDSSGQVTRSSQRPLPNNTQHSQQTKTYAPVVFEPTISAGEGPQAYALDRAATVTGSICFKLLEYYVVLTSCFVILFMLLCLENGCRKNLNDKCKSDSEIVLSYGTQELGTCSY